MYDLMNKRQLKSSIESSDWIASHVINRTLHYLL